jgi:endoglucanase
VSEAGGAAGDVVAVAAAQEETTLGGARTVAHRIQPDVAIVVDVTHATDVPGVEEREHGAHHLGSGPVIGRGATLHPKVFELLHDAGEAEGISFSVEASARSTGTDADAINTTRAGIPCGLVSLPLRYMHSPVETVELSDVHAAARLIAAFCRRLEPGTAFTR